jgi:hypothetical protein
LELEWSFANLDGVGVELELKFLLGMELEWLTPGVAHLWIKFWLYLSLDFPSHSSAEGEGGLSLLTEAVRPTTHRSRYNKNPLRALLLWKSWLHR